MKKIFLLFLFLFFSFFCFSNDYSFWKNQINTAFANLSSIKKINNSKLTSDLQSLQYKYSWLPHFSFDIPIKYNLRSSSSIFTRGIENITPYTNIIENEIAISLNQKLLGNGNLNFYSGYGLSYNANTNSFLQKPLLNLSISQNLSPDIINKNSAPEIILINLQSQFSDLTFYKDLFAEFEKVINLIADFDNQYTEKLYLTNLLDYYEIHYTSFETKNKNGSKSFLDSYYARQQMLNLKNQIAVSDYENNYISSEISILIPTLSAEEINKYRLELLNFISPDYSTNSSSIDIELYKNQIEQQTAVFRKNEYSILPVLYFNAQLSPDTNRYFQYSDFYNSFRELSMNPFPWNFSFSSGIKFNLESKKEKKIRQDVFSFSINSLSSEMELIAMEQKKQKILLINQINNLESFYSTLSTNLTEEEKFCNEKKILLENGYISEEEYMSSYISYLESYKYSVNIFWELIKHKIALCKLTESYKQIILNLGVM